MHFDLWTCIGSLLMGWAVGWACAAFAIGDWRREFEALDPKRNGGSIARRRT